MLVHSQRNGLPSWIPSSANIATVCHIRGFVHKQGVRMWVQYGHKVYLYNITFNTGEEAWRTLRWPRECIDRRFASISSRRQVQKYIPASMPCPGFVIIPGALKRIDLLGSLRKIFQYCGASIHICCMVRFISRDAEIEDLYDRMTTATSNKSLVTDRE